MSTLSKFGVPLDGSRTAILHPKQSYRFRVRFSSFGLVQGVRELTNQVVSCTRPKLDQQIVTLDVYNSKGYIAGKHEWSTIELVIRDDITSAIASEVGAQVQKQVNHFEQTSSKAGENYKFTLNIDAMDGTNNDELESWLLEGCWISNASFPDGDYSSSDDSRINLTIRYDNALLMAGAQGGSNPFTDIASAVTGSLFG